MKYDLEERTAKFGEAVIQFCKQLKFHTINQPLVHQLIKSATSIGANYMEANGGSSKKDFKNEPDPAPRAQGIWAGSFRKVSAPPTDHYHNGLNPRGQAAGYSATRNKIYISKKDAHETKHWLRMLAAANPEQKDRCVELWNEDQEITLIFGKILSKLKNNN